MPKVAVYKTDGTEAGKINLKDEVFGVKVNEAVMHQVVVTQLSAKAAGQSTPRSEVAGGGSSPGVKRDRAEQEPVLPAHPSGLRAVSRLP